MPADIGEPLAEGDHRLDGLAQGDMPHVMEARAAETGSIETLEFSVADRRLHKRDAAIGAAFGGERVGGGGIIGAVAGGVHDHAMFDAEQIVQREQFFLGRVLFGQAHVGEGKAAFRSHDMHMRVAGAGRQFQFRPAGRVHKGLRLHRFPSLFKQPEP